MCMYQRSIGGYWQDEDDDKELADDDKDIIVHEEDENPYEDEESFEYS